jgi:hypothetical protein
MVMPTSDSATFDHTGTMWVNLARLRRSVTAGPVRCCQAVASTSKRAGSRGGKYPMESALAWNLTRYDRVLHGFAHALLDHQLQARGAEEPGRAHRAFHFRVL